VQDEDDSLDSLGDDDDVQGVRDIVQGIYVISIGVQDLSKRMYVIMQKMINQSVWHGRTMNDQWEHVQDCVAEVYLDSNINTNHSEKHFDSISDYAQNVERPFLGDQHPGETYYLSPTSVVVFGMVDMTHAYHYVYEMISEHLHTQVYPEKVGDMGSNNVASLIMKTLSQLDALREGKPRGKLTFFYNCSGKTKTIESYLWLLI
jgi:hypothetical protein